MHEIHDCNNALGEATSIQRKEMVDRRISMLEIWTKSPRTLRTACPPDLTWLNTALCRLRLQSHMAHNHLGQWLM